MLHSLFQKAAGELLKCGFTHYCKLFSHKPSNDHVYLPFGTGMPKSATFYIAGFATSTVFIGHYPIQSPNRRIIEETGEMSVVEHLSVENELLKNTIK